MVRIHRRTCRGPYPAPLDPYDPATHGPTLEFKKDIGKLKEQKNKKAEESSFLSGFGWFKKNDDRTFKFEPPPAPPKVRTLGEFAGPVNDQEDSLFFKLPAEVRNPIYDYIFNPEKIVHEVKISGLDQPLDSAQPADGEENTGAGRISTSTTIAKAHPLSLLSTCRKINSEAAFLAFQVHPFNFTAHIKKNYIKSIKIFYIFRQYVECLPAPLCSAITHLIYDVDCPHRSGESASDFVINSLLLFSNLKRLDLTTGRNTKSASGNELHPWRSESDVESFRDLHNEAIQRYAPRWFTGVFTPLISEWDVSWQKEQKWHIEYGLVESGAFAISDWEDDALGRTTKMERIFVNRELVDKVDGLESCGCGCESGRPMWLKAKLVQQTGRTVDARAILPSSVKEMRYKVQLLPNAKRLPTQVVGEGSGMMWDGEEDFWKGRRS